VYEQYRRGSRLFIDRLCSSRSDLASHHCAGGPLCIDLLGRKRLYFAPIALDVIAASGNGARCPGRIPGTQWDLQARYDEEVCADQCRPLTEQNCSPPFLEVPASGIMDLEERWCRQSRLSQTWRPLLPGAGFGTWDQIRALLECTSV
jgi:hypothetical protein